MKPIKVDQLEVGDILVFRANPNANNMCNGAIVMNLLTSGGVCTYAELKMKHVGSVGHSRMNISYEYLVEDYLVLRKEKNIARCAICRDNAAPGDYLCMECVDA